MIIFSDLETYSVKFLQKYKKTRAYGSCLIDENNNLHLLKQEELNEDIIRTTFDKLFELNENNPTGEIYVYYLYSGKFDGWFLLNYLKKWEEESDDNAFYEIIEDNKQILKYELNYNHDHKGKPKKKIILLDAYRVWPLRLKDLGKSIGLEKLDYDIYDILDVNLDKEENNKLGYNTEEMLKYLKRDVEILVKFYQKTKHIIKLGKGAPLTIASASMNKFLKTKTGKKYKFNLLWLENPELWNKINLSYQGGYTNITSDEFKLKKLKNIYKYDVNSLYPSVMLKEIMPYGIPRYINDDWNDIIYYEYTFEKYTFNTPFGWYSFMTFKKMEEQYLKYEKNGIIPSSIYEKVVYGNGETFYTNNVMLDFLKKNGKFEGLKTKFLCGFKGKYNVFDEYLNYHKGEKERMTAENKEKYAAEILIHKLKMNSLYGKFGQDNFIKSTRIKYIDEIKNKKHYFETEKQIWFNGYKAQQLDDELIAIKQDDGYSYVKLKQNNEIIIKLSYIPIADMITTYARIELLKDVLKNKEIWDKVVYFDTDSIHSLVPLDKYLEINPAKIGAWKFEGRVETAVYRRRKHYLHVNIHEDKENSEKITKDYLLKGGGFNVALFNETKVITPDIYSYKEILVPRGKRNSVFVPGGKVIFDSDYKFNNPFTTDDDVEIWSFNKEISYEN